MSTRLVLSSNNARSFAILSGISLCLVSVFYTCLLTKSLADPVHEQILMMISGIGFEICKYLFIPIGIALFSRGYIFHAIPLLSIGTALILVSLCASLGFLESRQNVASENARIKSDQYQRLDSQFNTIERQINTLLQTAKIDSNSRFAGVRGRSSNIQNQIAELRREKMIIFKKMNLINGENSTSAGALFNGISSLFNIDSKLVKTATYSIVAILIELCGITALSVAGLGTSVSLNRNEKRFETETLPNANIKGNHSVPKRIQYDTGTREEKANSRFKRISSNIQNGKLKPSIRAVMKSENVSYPVARNYFDELEQREIVKRVGSKFQLTQPNI